MAAKCMLFAVLAVFAVSQTTAGVVPVAAAAYVSPYASSYNGHIVNHAVAAPLIAAPAYTAAAYTAYPYNEPLVHAAAYSAYPYAAYSASIIAK